jgi:hypothetical protein
MTDKNNTETTPKFSCETCSFKCSKKTEWERHVTTRKHINNQGDLPTEPIIHNCICGKKYKHRQSLFNHKKTCNFKSPPEKNDCIIETTPQSTVTNEMIINLIEQNQELQKQLVELSKQAKIVNNTMNNNNNFNLNLFLNEDCKNALNIVEFIESLKLTVNDLEQTGKVGFAQGISRIFIQALRQLDVNMRPLHCTDMKRETFYIKDRDIWEKENAEKTKLRKVLRQIARKNLRMLPAWQKQNPDFQFIDTPENDEFIRISLSALGPESEEEQEKQEDKIIRNVLKEVSIDKNRRIDV